MNQMLPTLSMSWHRWEKCTFQIWKPSPILYPRSLTWTEFTSRGDVILFLTCTQILHQSKTMKDNGERSLRQLCWVPYMGIHFSTRTCQHFGHQTRTKSSWKNLYMILLWNTALELILSTQYSVNWARKLFGHQSRSKTKTERWPAFRVSNQT